MTSFREATMLTLTENATTVVKTIAQQSQDDTTLRITSESSEEQPFAVSTATEPGGEDQVIEQDGATVYLDSDAATQLDDKVLDAAVDESGNVQFSIGMQGDTQEA